MLRISRKTIATLLPVVLVAAVLAMAGIVYTGRDASQEVTGAQKLSHNDFMAEKRSLVERMERQGADGIFALLKERMRQDPSVARECHPLLHELGHAAYDYYGGFSEAIVHQDEFCNSGFTHGIIEAAFMEGDDILATMQSVCPTDEAENYKQWQCFHGVGHGLMYAQGKNVVKSLALCEQLTSAFATASCGNGVFMEKFIIVGHNGIRVEGAAADHSLCKQQADRYKADCYIYAPTAFLQDNSNAYTKAFTWCEQIEEGYANACIQGVGGQAMKENVTKPAFTAKLCSSAKKDIRQACVQGALGVFINHHGLTAPAKKLCTEEFATFKNDCLAIVKEKHLELAI